MYRDEPPKPSESVSAAELRDAWPALSEDERVEGFRLLAPTEAEDLLLSLGSHDQAVLIRALPQAEQKIWIRQLEPDDAADVVQRASPEERQRLLGLLDESHRKEVTGLLAYAEDAAGGLMNPRYAQARADMSVDEAVTYLRRQAREKLELPYYVYVLDQEQRLVGVVSFREVFAAPPQKTVREVMRTDLVKAPVEMDQESLSRLFAQHDLLAIPIVDAAGHMKGVVTVDDIVDVVQEEATEDAQKFGGMEALDTPYLTTSILTMLKKRGGWLAALFIGELLTASAMSRFEDELERALVLAMFIPLIISSGGNSGSQASTLIIRAMAVGEVRLRDWWRVARREVLSGLGLGTLLGALGFVRVMIWQGIFGEYGDHYVLISLTVGMSVLGVVMYGTLCGSMLPFVLRRIGLDPASASAPFVATLVDVTGIVIYFSVAAVVLHGTLL